MTLIDIISNIEEQNEEATIFAKKVGGKFLPSSEATLVEVKDDEMDLQTSEIANRYCPEFDYFLEVFLVKDWIQDMNSEIGFKSLEQQVERIIQYAEADA